MFFFSVLPCQSHTALFTRRCSNIEHSFEYLDLLWVFAAARVEDDKRQKLLLGSTQNRSSLERSALFHPGNRSSTRLRSIKLHTIPGSTQKPKNTWKRSACQEPVNEQRMFISIYPLGAANHKKDPKNPRNIQPSPNDFKVNFDNLSRSRVWPLAGGPTTCQEHLSPLPPLTHQQFSRLVSSGPRTAADFNGVLQLCAVWNLRRILGGGWSS